MAISGLDLMYAALFLAVLMTVNTLATLVSDFIKDIWFKIHLIYYQMIPFHILLTWPSIRLPLLAQSSFQIVKAHSID